MPVDKSTELHQGLCLCKPECLDCIVWTYVIPPQTVTLLEMDTDAVEQNPLLIVSSKSDMGGF